MENVLKVTVNNDGDSSPRIESTYNPGNFNLPSFAEKDGSFYIHFPGEEVSSAIAQSNDFSQLLIGQMEYQDNGVVVRFVTLNSEVKAVDFTIRMILKKATKVLDRPSPLSEVLAESLLSVGKDRP
jgi:hypothetical protein